MSEKKGNYIGSLDGLRALAVLLVLAYHFEFSFARGGFLGVDFFFVLSGYLITVLLMKEYEKKGNFSIVGFWLKRLRRILPALVFMLLIVSLFSYLFYPTIFNQSKKDLVPGLFFYSNWWYIIQEVPYFQAFGIPRLFKHLWSLAVEVQFYLIWPIIFLLLIRLIRNKQQILRVLYLGIFMSVVLMAGLYAPTSLDRVYYGTDTRLFTLLIGACLGISWPFYKLSETTSPQASFILDALGLTSVIGLVFILSYANEYQAILYRGGFLLVALLISFLIGVLVHPTSHLARLFSLKPLRWIGERSYSLYLWHFPIIALFTPAKTIGTSQPLLILMQLILIFLLANFSYTWIEQPLRKGSLWQVVKKSFKQIKQQPLSYLVTIVASLAITAGLETNNYLLEKKTVATVKTEASSLKKELPRTDSSPKEQAIKKTVAQVLLLGDSTMLGAKEEIEELDSRIVIDAAVGRQMYEASTIVEEFYPSYNTEKTVAFIALGANSPFEQSSLNRLIALLGEAQIYLITVRVPKNWEQAVNQSLAKASTEFENVTLIDWHAEALSHPEYLVADGVHLSNEGILAYRQLISDHLADFEWGIDEAR